jgi:diguanylate cyclase (GGDEF)-like protein
MIPGPTAALLAFKKSLTIKIFSICFICVHVPLIALIAYLATGFHVEAISVFTLMLIATLIGTATCLLTLWRLLEPLRNLTAQVTRYRADGTPVEMVVGQQDEIGRLAGAVTAMIGEADALTKRLRHQATTDPLTGLGNRRWLGERVAEELARAQRQGEPVSLVVFDLDRFKAINDTHGHDVGDKVLMAASEMVKSALRPYDLAARIGGEEFCIVMPRTDKAGAAAFAERLRTTLEASLIAPLAKGRVTASFGICEAVTGSRLQQMLKEADTALYRAKEEGRNRIVIADQPAPIAPYRPGHRANVRAKTSIGGISVSGISVSVERMLDHHRRQHAERQSEIDLGRRDDGLAERSARRGDPSA